MLFDHVASPTCSNTTFDAAPTRQTQDLRCNIRGVMVDRSVHPKFARPLQFFLGAGRCNHARALQIRNLYRGLADAAAGRQHQHIFPAGQPGPRHQHVPRGEERQRKRGCADEVDRIGDRNDVLDRHRDVLGIAAGMIPIAERLVRGALIIAAGDAFDAVPAADARLQHDPGSGGEAGCGSRGCDDLSGHIAAGNMRHRERHALESTPFPDVEIVQRARSNPDQHFPWSGHRIRRVLVTQNLRTAVLMEPYGFHLVI